MDAFLLHRKQERMELWTMRIANMSWAYRKILQCRDIPQFQEGFQPFLAGSKFSIKKLYNNMQGPITIFPWKRLM